MEKPNKHQIRSQNTKMRLINKLSEIIRNGEIDQFNIRGLCSELGLSPRTFYLYFESKEHAINQCYIFQEEIFIERVKSINHDLKDPWDRLMNIFQVGLTITEAEIVTVQRRLISVLHVYDEYINSEDIAFYQMVKKELDACVNEKKMKFTIETTSLAWELILYYRGLVYNYMSTHGHFPILKHGVEHIERYAQTFIEA